MNHLIPLNALSLSASNVRKTPSDTPCPQLLASIRDHGLQQNLVVIPKNKRAKTYAVVAGGRRLHALQALSDSGDLDPDTPIPCRIEFDKARAAEVSLVENELRLNMSPAQAYQAFKALVETGTDVSDIAKRFGLTERFVKQRLALAALAPDVFAALSDGTISLDVAEAFANCPDTARQSAVFEQARYNLTNRNWIAGLLKESAVSSSNRLAVFVGEEAYIEADGTITRQLFEDDTLFDDAALLQDLAMTKLASAVEGQAAELGIAEICPLPDTYAPYQVDGYTRLFAKPREMTDDEGAARERLQATLDDLETAYEAADAEEDAARLGEALDAAQTALEAFDDALRVLDPELLAQAICFAFIADHGKVVIEPKYFVPNRLIAKKTPASDEENDGAGEGAPLESAKHRDALSQHRAQILGAWLARDDVFAQDIGRFELIRSCLTSSHGETGFALAPPSPDTRARVDLSGTFAADALRASMKDLDDEWLHAQDLTDMFAKFRALPEAQKTTWFALAVAQTVMPRDAAGPKSAPFHNMIFDALEYDMADWWRPTVESYFGRVTKARCLDIAEEIGGPDLRTKLGKRKKADLAKALEDVCAGRGHLSAETRAKAIKWLPASMTFDADTTLVPTRSFGPLITAPWLETGSEGDLGSDDVDALPEETHSVDTVTNHTGLPETEEDIDVAA